MRDKDMRNLTITFTNYTPDKLLKMYCRYFLFFPRLALVSFMYHPTVLMKLQCFCLHVYSDQLKPGNGISFCMVLAFFFCYVSDKVVSFIDSIPMRNIA